MELATFANHGETAVGEIASHHAVASTFVNIHSGAASHNDLQFSVVGIKNALADNYQNRALSNLVITKIDLCLVWSDSVPLIWSFRMN